MKNYAQVLLLMFVFSFMTLIALKCTNGVDPFTPVGKSTLLINWIAIPEGMDSIQFEISSLTLTSNIVKKFAFSDDTGSLPDFLEKITMDIQITGYDSAQSIVCHGKIDSIKTTTPTTILTLNAYNVTPYKPDSLIATPLLNDKISLQWKYDTTLVDYFTLYRMTGSTNLDSVPFIIATSYIDSGLTPLQWYTYYVKGYNASGYSLPSNVDSAMVNTVDNQGPIITITSHTNPDTVQTQEITLAGTVTDTSGIYQFLVNDSLQNVTNNTWQVDNLLLTSSVNIINIKAYDNSPAQNLTDTSIMIIYKDSLPNHPPVFITTADSMTDSITLNGFYVDTVSAVDIDSGDIITYAVVTGPVSIDQSGIIQWTANPVGIHTIVVTATDTYGESDSLSWTITVLPSGNNAPYFVSTSDSMTNLTHSKVLYCDTVHAIDPDGDSLMFSIIDSLGELTMKDSIISWRPLVVDTGVQTLKVMVRDSLGLSDTLAWNVTVYDTISYKTLITVKKSGGDYELLSQAMPMADNNDTILVFPGTYLDNTSVANKKVYVLSESGAQQTILTSPVTTRTIRLNSGSNTVIRGFTFDNQLNTAAAIIGGGLDTAIIENCIFINNTVESESPVGGGTRAPIFRCDNASSPNALARIKNCVIYNAKSNDGLIYIPYDMNIEILNCLLFNNNSIDYCGGIWLRNTTKAKVLIDHCTIYNCIAARANAIEHLAGNGGYVKNCIVYGNTGTISSAFTQSYTYTSNPNFVDVGSMDFHLNTGSPCIDAGDPSSPNDPDGSRADMGVIFPYLPKPFGDSQ